MTTKTQTQNQGSLVSKLAGAAVGAGATLACLYNPTLTPYVAVGVAGAAAGNYLHSKYGSEGALTRIRRFAASGLLTATLLTGGYFVGRTQSDITAVLPQAQGIEIKQADGRTTPFTKQADGAYLPLEQRLDK